MKAGERCEGRNAAARLPARGQEAASLADSSTHEPGRAASRDFCLQTDADG